MEYLINRLYKENRDILMANWNLQHISDFSEEGKKLFKNDLMISNLKKLPVPLVDGSCNCKNSIIRDDVIKYCAWCHKQIKDE